MEPSKTILYGRVSSRGQLRGTGLQGQLQGARVYCQQQGWPVDRELTDEGRSAFHGHHRTKGNLGTFEQDTLAGLEAGTRLVCENLDRLSRADPEDSYDFVRSLTRNGVTIVTYTDGETYTAKTDIVKILKQFLIYQRANEEAETKSKRAKRNWKIKYERAAQEGKALSTRCKPWLRVVDGKYELRTEHLPLITRILTMADSGEGSLTITKALNAERVAKFDKAKHWNRTDVIRLLADRSLVGEAVIGGETVKLYPPAVPADLFERVYAAAVQRKSASVGVAASPRMRNLLSGLCRCDVCNGPVNLIGNPHPQLRCKSNSLRMGCTNSTPVNYAKLEKVVLDQCLHLALDDNAFTNRTEVARLNVTIAERTNDLKAAQERARSLMGLFATQQSELAQTMALEAEQRAKELEANLAALKAQREQAKGRASGLEHMKRVADMRAKLATDVTLRKRVAIAFQGLVTQVWFAEDGTVTLAMAGGMAAMRVRDGQVLKCAHMAGAAQAGVAKLHFAGKRDKQAAPAVTKRLVGLRA